MRDRRVTAIFAFAALACAAIWFARDGGRGRMHEPGPGDTAGDSAGVVAAGAPSAAPTAAPSPTARVEERPRPTPRIAAAPANGGGDRGGGGAGNLVEFEVVRGQAIAYGDLILGQPEEGSNVRRGRTEVQSLQLWPGGEVPYAISRDLADPKRVEQAIEYFNRNTTVRFVPYQNQTDAVLFETGAEDCYSYPGRVGGVQPIQLSPSCQTPQIIHEMMHAIGFVHEQMRLDRDQYIEVLWDNIDEKHRTQFAVAPEIFLEGERGTPFDYHSLMLYPSGMFAARPGLPTMRSRGPEPIAPARDGLSEGDLARVARLYRR